ncbi:MAG TPA: CARDB domain-containing protein [Chloroflexota bacterium]|nr:CARDB domain-containing protein [Chloroflexota bacterium]
MNGFKSTMRRVLQSARRLGIPVGLVAILLVTVFGAPAPARADDPQVRDHRDGQGPVLREPRVQDPGAPPPVVRDHRTGGGAVAQLQADDTAARIQIMLKTIHVANDRDGAWRGSGELSMTVSFFRCAGPQPPCGSGSDPAVLVAEWKRDFGADSGDARTFDRIMPITADVKDGALASEDGGLLLQDGRSYMFQVTMYERDTVVGDHMGGIQRIIDKSNYWGVGTYEREAAGPLKEPSFGNSDLCAGCGGIIVGDYLVTYEIFAASLPDLRPTAIRLLGDAGDGLEEVCLAVQNQGPETAGPFNMSLFVDQAPALNGSVNLLGLAGGTPHESCFRTSLPTSGLHSLDLIVDQARAVPEGNERNNQLQQDLDRGPAQPTPTPATPDNAGPTPSSGASPVPSPGPILVQGQNQGKPRGEGLSDLTVSAIRVRGQVPDGKDDCKDGGNDVAVVVKNSGSEKAGGFAVRLTVDGGEPDEESVNGLEAGKEREVKFENVRLKKGDRTLLAVADATKAIAESKEDNNELKVTARCQDDD